MCRIIPANSVWLTKNQASGKIMLLLVDVIIDNGPSVGCHQDQQPACLPNSACHGSCTYPQGVIRDNIPPPLKQTPAAVLSLCNTILATTMLLSC